MMSIGLHLMIGRPDLTAALESIVDRMKGKGGAWFATRPTGRRAWLSLAA